MKAKALVFIVLAFLVAFFAAPGYADTPALPHSFYGDVIINGSAAPSGTSVEARGDGVLTGTAGNPITTSQAGKYGGPGSLEPKLVVQGDIDNEDTITFYVNGHSTGQIASFEAGGGPTLKNLTVTIAPPTPAPAANGKEAPVPPEIWTNLFGITARYPISSDGEILETIQVTSADGMLTVIILKGTIALDKYGDRLERLDTRIDESPLCPSPEDAYIIGLAYNFEPDGATFAPPITFTWSYDPDALPEGIAEEDLFIACCDEDAGKWVKRDCVVDTKNNIITASVPHFTTFAIIGSVTPPPPAPAPAPPAPAPAPAPTPVPAPAPAPPTPPLPPAPEVIPTPAPNWPLIGGIVGGAIVVGLIIILLVRRRREAY